MVHREPGIDKALTSIPTRPSSTPSRGGLAMKRLHRTCMAKQWAVSLQEKLDSRCPGLYPSGLCCPVRRQS